MTENIPRDLSRRNFIKGVVAAGAVASSSAYLFRSTTLHGQPSGAGSVERLITLNVNGQDRRVDVMPQETLAMTLRYKLAGLPVRVLHARVRDGGDRLSENEPEPDAPGARARRVRQSVPLPGLRQDSHGADERR